MAGDYRLAAGSPCIDTGNDSYVVVAVDLDGNTRMVGSSVDMGAYEYSGAPDSDGDGMTDDEELIAGTGINDPADFFQLDNIAADGSGAELSWTAVGGRQYSVYWTDDLVEHPFILLTNGLAGGSFEDLAHTGDTNGFYLIKVELVP